MASIPNRSAQTISGRSIGTYTGGDGFMLIAAPDLKTHRVWTAWTGANTTSMSTTVSGLTVLNGSAAMIATSNGTMTTVNPLGSSSLGKSDLFYSVFPARK
jgi:hypothetical protein